MALTKSDVNKINKKITKAISELFDKLVVFLSRYPNKEEVGEIMDAKLKPVKEQIMTVQDGFVEIKEELRTEHEFRYKKLEETVERVDQIEQHLGIN